MLGTSKEKFSSISATGAKDHFYTQTNELGTTEAGHRGNHGYLCEGVAFYLAENETIGYLPVYRAWNGITKDHMYTTSEEEKDNLPNHGYSIEGVIGYISTTQVEGTVPVYRYWNDHSHDHLYTTNAFEIGTTEPGSSGNHGYTCEGVMGYAYLDNQ